MHKLQKKVKKSKQNATASVVKKTKIVKKQQKKRTTLNKLQTRTLSTTTTTTTAAAAAPTVTAPNLESPTSTATATTSKGWNAFQDKLIDPTAPIPDSISPLYALATPPGNQDYAEINAVSKELKKVWKNYPTQMKAIQFPSWCLDKLIPTKPLTWLLDEITKSDSGDLTETKRAVEDLFIPLWRGFHQKLAENNEKAQFDTIIENDFSPSATQPENGDKCLKYPQVLHHHTPKILDITRHYYNIETLKLKPLDPVMFQTKTVTEEQFEALYESTILIRYLHHQESLKRYIKQKYMEIADIALYPPAFTETVRHQKQLLQDNPELKDQHVNLQHDIPALKQMKNLAKVNVDITNKKVPLPIRYKFYVQRSPLLALALSEKLLHLPPDHMELLNQCNLPSDPILHSLHGIAKQLSKTQSLIDAGMATFPLKEFLVDYGDHVWSYLNLYLDPTEARKERFYSERGYYDMDSFYRVSIGNRKKGGWVGKDDPVVPYPLTEQPAVPKALTQPLDILTVSKYGLKYAERSYFLPKERHVGSFSEEILEPTIPYVKILYTAKTVNQDTFGTGTDLDYWDNPEPTTALIDRVEPFQSFTHASRLLSNPAKSHKGQMLGLKPFSENFRDLYENSNEFRECVLRNFDEESRSVTNQLEAAYHAIQRQHEWWQYHTELERISTPEGQTYKPVPFQPDEETLQRYNDQAYYLQEIITDMELWSKAWIVLGGAPQTKFNIRSGLLDELERKRISDDFENKLVILKWAPRQSAIFLQKWLEQQTKPNNEINSAEAWDDFFKFTRILHKFDTPIPDRRRCIGAVYTEFHDSLPENDITDVRKSVVNRKEKKVAQPQDVNKTPYELVQMKLKAERDASLYQLEEENPKYWEHDNGESLPAVFDFGDDLASRPLFASQPKGPKGEKRVISRFEFPTRVDLYSFFSKIKVFAKKGGRDELTYEDRVAMLHLKDFYSLKKLDHTHL